jgi:hypothetical protein
MTKKDDKNDPTVTSDRVGPGYPDGTHAALPVGEVTHSADRIKYRDAPDKPDPSTVAQVADIPEGLPRSVDPVRGRDGLSRPRRAILEP